MFELLARPKGARDADDEALAEAVRSAKLTPAQRVRHEVVEVEAIRQHGPAIAGDTRRDLDGGLGLPSLTKKSAMVPGSP